MKEHTNKEKQLANVLSQDGPLILDKITRINHKPHYYIVGEEFENRPCTYPGCDTPYHGHTSDEVGAVRLIRDATSEELYVEYRNIVTQLGEDFIDGIILLDGENKFKIT